MDVAKGLDAPASGGTAPTMPMILEGAGCALASFMLNTGYDIAQDYADNTATANLFNQKKGVFV